MPPPLQIPFIEIILDISAVVIEWNLPENDKN